MIYEKTLVVNEEQLSKLQNLLNMDEADYRELGVDGDTTFASFRANFENGFYIDTLVCGTSIPAGLIEFCTVQQREK